MMKQSCMMSRSADKFVGYLHTRDSKNKWNKIKLKDKMFSLYFYSNQ
jgi:hypothetical protein